MVIGWCDRAISLAVSVAPRNIDYPLAWNLLMSRGVQVKFSGKVRDYLFAETSPLRYSSLNYAEMKRQQCEWNERCSRKKKQLIKTRDYVSLRGEVQSQLRHVVENQLTTSIVPLGCNRQIDGHLSTFRVIPQRLSQSFEFYSRVWQSDRHARRIFNNALGSFEAARYWITRLFISSRTDRPKY